MDGLGVLSAGWFKGLFAGIEVLEVFSFLWF